MLYNKLQCYGCNNAYNSYLDVVGYVNYFLNLAKFPLVVHLHVPVIRHTWLNSAWELVDLKCQSCGNACVCVLPLARAGAQVCHGRAAFEQPLTSVGINARCGVCGRKGCLTIRGRNRCKQMLTLFITAQSCDQYWIN